MKKHNKYTLLGLKALRRAASKVAEDARKNNYKIPIWKDGHIVYETPQKVTSQDVSVDQDQDSPIEH